MTESCSFFFLNVDEVHVQLKWVENLNLNPLNLWRGVRREEENINHQTK